LPPVSARYLLRLTTDWQAVWEAELAESLLYEVALRDRRQK